MSLLDYFGRFHPGLVHIPIGTFLGIILLECLALKPKFKNVLPATRVLFMLGFVAASVAALTGYLHAQAEDFDEELVNIHMILGISVAVVSFVAIILNGGKASYSRKAYLVSLAVLGALTVFAGHTGASITYGSQYLNPANIANGNDEDFSSISKDTPLYAGVIKPIFDRKCISCHGPSRQKGKLRLDTPDFIARGGEDGEIINKSFPNEGELWRRIMLEMSDDDHMPPVQKPQLSKAEISLIVYWLENGVDFTASLGAIPKSDSIMKLVRESSPEQTMEDSVVPMPDEKIIKVFERGGVTVSFLSKDDGRVALQFINAEQDSISYLLSALPSINEQVIEIKMPGRHASHEDWKKLGALKNIRKLSLENSNFSDEDLASVQALTKMEYLNLIGTAVTSGGLEKISLPELRKLYLFKTGVGEADLTKLKQHFPNAEIVVGNFQVPTLKGDTTEQKEKYVVPIN